MGLPLNIAPRPLRALWGASGVIALTGGKCSSRDSDLTCWVPVISAQPNLRRVMSAQAPVAVNPGELCAGRALSLAVCLAGSEGHPVAQPGGPGVCARPVRGEHRERGASHPPGFQRATEMALQSAKQIQRNAMKTTHYSKD
jgi:hypothetical protein